MKSTLEKVWDWLQPDHLPEQSETQKRLLDALNVSQRELWALLNEEQKNAVRGYEYALVELNNFFETQAFIKGVRFATSYMLEAVNKK